MNALNFLQLRQSLGTYIDRNASNDLPFLGQLVNEAYLALCKITRSDFLYRTAYLPLTAPYTAGTVAVNIGSKTVTGNTTAFTDSMVNQAILLRGQAYRIASVTSGTVLVLDRSYEATNNITDDVTSICFDTYPLPWGWDYPRLSSVRDPLNQQLLRKVTKEKFDAFFPNPSSSGTPVFACAEGYLETQTAAFTQASGAGTTTISLANLTGASTVDDFYNMWYVINTTQTLTSMITDYNGTTKMATVSPPITAQSSSDTTYLKQKISMLRLYPMPDKTQTLVLRGFILPDYLVADSDIPWAVPDQYHPAIWLTAASRSGIILDDARKNAIDKELQNVQTELQSEYNASESEDFKRGSIDENNESADFFPYNFPIRTP